MEDKNMVAMNERALADEHPKVEAFSRDQARNLVHADDREMFDRAVDSGRGVIIFGAGGNITTFKVVYLRATDAEDISFHEVDKGEGRSVQ